MIRRKESGQALVMVTLALMAMCGMMGLAVDLGWSFYVHKTERQATDAAALAGVETMYNTIQGLNSFSVASGVPALAGPYTCGTTIICQSLTPCSSISTDPLLTACNYAKQNGFQAGGMGGAQNLQIESGVGTPPTAPGVNNALYWVHVVAAQSVPQLFSAVFRNTKGLVAADSTGALADTIVTGNLILTNGPNDPLTSLKGKAPPAGTNLWIQGGGSVTVGGGIIMSSSNPNAASNAGGTTAPYAIIAGNTIPSICGPGGITVCTNAPASSTIFDDPEAGKGQPPILACSGSICTGGASPNLNYHAVPGGTLNCTSGCAPGVYYSTSTTKGGSVYADGGTLSVNGGSFNAGGNFGTYVFVGGLNVGGSVAFNPGEYVMAGTNNAGNDVFYVDGDTTSSVPNGAGQLFLLTSTNYVAFPGDTTMSRILSGVPNPQFNAINGPPQELYYGSVEYKCGNCNNELSGLNPGSANLPADLQAFAPFVLWQDQQNSAFQYDSRGNIVMCGANPCNNNNLAYAPNSNSQIMLWWGGRSSGATISGAIYQPRGGSFDIHSATGVNSVVQLITGGVTLQGSPSLSLLPSTTSSTQLKWTLVH